MSVPSSEAMSAGVRLVRPSERIAELVIDHPPRNVIGMAERASLSEHIASLERDQDISVLVLRAEGTSFCAGNDIRELDPATFGTVDVLIREWDEIWRRLRRFPGAVIAGVQGYALGGGFELMLSCDLRVAAADARVGATAANLAVVMSTHSLPRSLPQAIANEMALTGRQLTASEALHFGLVNHVVPTEELDDTLRQLADRLAKQSREVVRMTKLLLSYAHVLTRDDHDFWQHAAFVELAKRPEHAEAVLDFLRTPRSPGGQS